MEWIPEALRTLPGPVIRQIKKREQPRSLEEIKASLIGEQLTGFNQLVEFMTTKEPPSNLFLFTGPAGSGKTTVITALAEWFVLTRDKTSFDCLALTATTNQSATVLHSKVTLHSDRFQFGTIHKFLQLKEKIDDYGNQLFVSKDDTVFPYGLKAIIIDEASMINRSLMTNIMRVANRLKTKVIFTMDGYQLRPVKEKDSILTNKEYVNEKKMICFALQNVVRQAEGNPIIQLATAVRTHQHYDTIPYQYHDSFTGMGSIHIVPRMYQFGDSPPNMGAVAALIRHFFINYQYDDDSYYTKVLAYHRDAVARVNIYIRQLIYGMEEAKQRWMIGEKLVANGPIFDYDGQGRKYIQFNNNEEFSIISSAESFEEVQDKMIKCYRLHVYKTEFNPFDEKPIKVEEHIKVLHESSQAVFLKMVDDYKQKALEASGTSRGGWLWKQYYELLETFADVRYAYALTVHKSQGSTYVNAIVLEKDLMTNAETIERNQLLYVAYTRPNTNLIIAR